MIYSPIYPVDCPFSEVVHFFFNSGFCILPDLLDCFFSRRLHLTGYLIGYLLCSLFCRCKVTGENRDKQKQEHS